MAINVLLIDEKSLIRLCVRRKTKYSLNNELLMI